MQEIKKIPIENFIIKEDIKISIDAINYLYTSLKKEKNIDLNLYLSVIYQSTKYTRVNIIYCKKEDINIEDIKLSFNHLYIYIDYKSINLLKNSVIEIKENQLCINAPNISNINKKKLTLEKEIKKLFEDEVNVILSQHGGYIELINIINNNTILVKFHGGCQGCGMVGTTLNTYIEKIIIKKFPQIIKITDITHHDVKTNSYY